MLIKADSSQLGNKVLSKEEDLLRMYEDTESKVSKFRLPDHDDLKDEKLRSGQRLHSSDFIFKLRKLIDGLQIREGNIPGCVALYDGRGNELKYLNASFQLGWMPEFTFIRVDRADLMMSAASGGVQQGWRTVLLRLLNSKTLTWEQVRREFGDARGEANTRWRQETQKFR
jgi:hypothetical protein